MPSFRQAIFLILVIFLCFALGGFKGRNICRRNCFQLCFKFVFISQAVRNQVELQMRLISTSPMTLILTGIIAAVGFIGVGKLILKPPSSMPSFNLNSRFFFSR